MNPEPFQWDSPDRLILREDRMFDIGSGYWTVKGPEKRFHELQCLGALNQRYPGRPAAASAVKIIRSRAKPAGYNGHVCAGCNFLKHGYHDRNIVANRMMPNDRNAVSSSFWAMYAELLSTSVPDRISSPVANISAIMDIFWESVGDGFVKSPISALSFILRLRRMHRTAGGTPALRIVAKSSGAACLDLELFSLPSPQF